jgi:hypothetical protein
MTDRLAANSGTKPLARLWSVPAGFLFCEKMTFLDILDMHFMIFDICCQYLIKIWSNCHHPQLMKQLLSELNGRCHIRERERERDIERTRERERQMRVSDSLRKDNMHNIKTLQRLKIEIGSNTKLGFWKCIPAREQLGATIG